MGTSRKGRIRSALDSGWLALLWLLVIAAASIVSAITLLRGYTFDSSVLALLPANAGVMDSGLDPELAQHADARLASLASNRMVFLVGHPDASTSSQIAGQFSEQLRNSDLFIAVHGRIDGRTARQWQETFFPYRYRLLSERAYLALRENEVSNDHPLLTEALARLYSPMASAVAATLVEDPLQLFFDWQSQATPKTPFSLENGWLSRKQDGYHFKLVSVELSHDPFSLQYQQAVTQTLHAVAAQLPANTQLLASGLLRHAAHGAAQARQEISTIGFGSLLGIALLLLYCFRSVRLLLLAFLPVATGWLFAAAISLTVFDSLHLITLAFGASLIGVAVDYSFHYLCAREEGPLWKGNPSSNNNGEAIGNLNSSAIQRILPGLSLGLISSALAYAAQGAAPFPGLRQMALFSVCGLLGAWLTVVLWLPRLAPSRREASIPLHQLADMFRRLLDAWPRVSSRPVAIVLAVFSGFFVFQLSTLNFDDDLRRLQTSPPELLAEDARVQALTGGVNPGQYLLVSGDSPEDLLRREESLQPKLLAMVQSEKLADYQAISRWVPSRERQSAHRQLNEEQVFASDGLAQMLASRLGAAELFRSMRQAFEEQHTPPLSVEQWLASEAGQQQAYLWLGDFEGSVHSLILLAGVSEGSGLQALQDIARTHPGVHFVDKVAGISQVLKSHRQELQLWIIVAYAAVLLLLSWHYGVSGWRIVAAPAIASLASLAILSASGWGINIFNLLALLLVLGIGLDAGIFLRGAGRSHYTWAAVSLAACTTLLAFGLLSLSETPVLKQFGITVLLGIVGVWLLAPCFTEKAQAEDAKSAGVEA